MTSRLRRALVTSFVLVAVTAIPAEAAKPPLVDFDCGDPVSASVRLADDLIDCVENGLVITADDVVLDLNGHLVDGNDVSFEGGNPDIGIDNGAGHTGVVITNGTLREFDEGVGIETSSPSGATTNNRVEDIVSSDNSIGVYIYRADDNAVLDSLIESNSTFGVLLDGSDRNTLQKNYITGGASGVKLSGSDFNILQGNEVSGATGTGIFAEASSDNTFTKNDSHGNSRGLMLAFTFAGAVSERNTVAKNDLSDNGVAGATLIASSDNILTGNKLERNFDGIQLQEAMVSSSLVGSDGNTIKKNAAYENDNYGVGVVGGTGNTLESNKLKLNGTGIYVSDASNDFIKNTVSASDSNGVALDGGADSNELTENKVSGSGDNGILDVGDDNHLNGNKVSKSGFAIIDGNGMNIDATADLDVDGTDNKAKTSDDLDNCLPAILCS